MNDEAMKNMKNAQRRDQHPFWIWESIMKTPEILKECLQGSTYEQVKKVAKKCQPEKRSTRSSCWVRVLLTSQPLPRNPRLKNMPESFVQRT